MGEVRLGKTKITERNVAIGIEQDVFRLKISIYNVVLMKMLEG